jgi:hypothetical protein
VTAIVVMLRPPANDNDIERRQVGYHRDPVMAQKLQLALDLLIEANPDHPFLRTPRR